MDSGLEEAEAATETDEAPDRPVGVLDVADCLDAARFLVQAGEVDGWRLGINGASAGGFTALCAPASEELFAAGASWFGIADLETFRQQAPSSDPTNSTGWSAPIPRRRPPTGPAHRCISLTGSPVRCCCRLS